MRIRGRRYDTGRWCEVCVEGPVVSRTVSGDGDCSGEDRDVWLAPALVDIQVNGCQGREFTSPALSTDDVSEITSAVNAMGVGRYCPTLTTHADEVLLAAVATIARACEELADVASCVAGIHLEGPFISPEDGPRGAHPREHCRLPDLAEFERLQAAAHGRIRLVTVAPELPGATELIASLAASGIVVGLGHTAADAPQIEAAVDAGATLSTHLGNGAAPLVHRHRNFLWPQLADDRLWASMIADGHHLPADMLRVFFRAKGVGRSILVSDMVGAGGLPPGRYRTSLGEQEVLEDGRLVVADQRELLAGAAAPLTRGIEFAVTRGGLPLVDAVRMASRNPAELLGTPVGGFRPGETADFVRFRWGPDFERSRLEVLETVVAGRSVFRSDAG